MACEINQKNVALIERMSKAKAIVPSHANINYLRRLANLCKGVHNDNRGAAVRLFSALSLGLPDRDLERFSKLACAQNKAACAVLLNINTWLREESWDMVSMVFADTADHLNICRLIQDGRSAKRIENELWNLDTANRDRAANEVFSWLIEELEDA